MNATKFAVLLVIGVLCANTSRFVTAQGGGIGPPIPPNPEVTNGPTSNVTSETINNSQGNGYAQVTQGPNGPSANANGNGYTGTSGSVSAQGPEAAANSNSGSSAQGAAQAAASRNATAASGNGSAGSESTAQGRTSVKKGNNGNQTSVG